MVIDSTVEFWVQGESAWSVEVISIADCGLRNAECGFKKGICSVYRSRFTFHRRDLGLRIADFRLQIGDCGSKEF